MCTPFRESGSMEVTANYLFMGPKDCRERITELQFLHWQRRGFHFRETGRSTLVETGIASSAGQRGHITCSPARQRVRLLQPVLSCSLGLRPILDLRGLNHCLRTYKFKMLTFKTIVSQIQLGDRFVTIDLKDAYFT